MMGEDCAELESFGYIGKKAGKFYKESVKPQ